MWDLNDFIELNPPDKGQDRSRLQHLSRIGATNSSFLEIGSKLIERQDQSIACFCQLPYATVSEPKSMSRPGITRLFELHFFPSALEVQNDGSQRLIDPQTNESTKDCIQITQIIAVTKYWGNRGSWYNAYSRMVTSSKLREMPFVPTEKSWLRYNHPIKVDDFENDLGKRLLLDCLEAIRRGIPSELSIEYRRLLSYFIMPFPGRVAFGGHPLPTIRHIAVKQPMYEDLKHRSKLPRSQSVFLSYGGPDEILAMALRTTLTENGVDTWWFPEDAQWGEKIHLEVRRNIKKYDRLLLLCSRRSLIRSGVLHELGEVLEREAAEGGKAIIIPIALDDVLEEEWWRFEPNPKGDPIECQFDQNELDRRKELAEALRLRVVGDLKGTSPGDEKWKKSIPKLLGALEQLT